MKKIAIKKGFITQKIGNGLAIFDGERSILYSLNSTGVFIFKKLAQGLNKSKIVDLLSNKYSISKNGVKHDVREFISELRKNKIIS